MNEGWSRGDKIAVLGLFLATIAVAAALAVVPEVRRAFGLNPDNSESMHSVTTAIDPVRASALPSDEESGKSGQRELTSAGMMVEGTVSASTFKPSEPDTNNRILFHSDREYVGGGKFKLYTIRPDGTGFTTLTARGSNDGPGAWSPDGRRVAFTSAVDDQWELFIIDADGSDRRRLTTHGRVTGVGSFSPDGSTIAFTANSDGNNEIYTIATDGTHLTKLTANSADDQVPLYSPDGSKIAFMSTRAGSDFQIYVANSDGTNPVRITWSRVRSVPTSWSPDGTRIAYHAGRNGSFQVFVMSADGTNRVQLTNAANDNSEPTWSPDGTKIAFLSCRQHAWVNNIWVMNPDGSDQHAIETEYAQHYNIRWSPVLIETKQSGRS